MPTYFKPLRRKIGVVTLALACVFMAGWVRSLSLDEMVVLSKSDHKIDRLLLASGVIVWERFLSDLPISGDYWTISALFGQVEGRDFYFEMKNTLENVQWKWKSFGIGIGCCEQSHLPRHTNSLITVMMVTYWSVVIPLTLLPAWLLLSKPRLAKAPKQ